MIKGTSLKAINDNGIMVTHKLPADQCNWPLLIIYCQMNLGIGQYDMIGPSADIFDLNLQHATHTHLLIISERTEHIQLIGHNISKHHLFV